MCACLVRRQHPAFPCTHSPTAFNASRRLGGTEIVCRGFRPWCCDTDSSSHVTILMTSSDPHGPLVTDPHLIRCDRPVPHSLSALLTPTCAAHAHLLKHWKGRTDWRIVLLALVRHPHAHSLTSSLARSHACFSRFLPAHFLSRIIFFLFFERTFPIIFIYAAHLGGAESPQAHPAPLAHRYHDNPYARKRAL